ncbi:membrane-targeted effector domain-containing toxin [Pseudomonas akapageensis]|uniref:membrane-targeted effector domain-containing toxin n=1 Tax=Pseudomonas akapageensis TaxID=2609961 RepID=UPI00140BFBFF|nr:membrane-targeted effector domain-containing toxin [Pseudomonas akapageensis]
MNSSPFSSDLRADLSTIAERVVRAFPDLHADARDTAARLLKTQGNLIGNPDRIYWHRFSGAVSSSRTFTGWEHYGTPDQSMTLTELVMRRFRASDQDNADLLALYGGFYTAGAEARKFDETNEVRLDPQHVLNALWALDFGATYQRRLEVFWRDHGGDVRTLAKLNYLSEALLAGLSGQLDEAQLKLVFDAAGFDSASVLDPAQFERTQPPRADVTVATLSLAGRASTDALWLQGASGGHVLYLPGAVPSFQGFASERDVGETLFGWLQVASCTEQLLAHFSSDPVVLKALRDQMNHSAKGPVADFVAQVQRRPVEGDPFTWMRDTARQRMVYETDAALRTNAELRAQLWVGYLGVAARLFGTAAPMGWPLALLAVAVNAASLGLNIEQAINGDSLQERRDSVLGAILAGIELLLNLPFLTPLGQSSAQPLAQLESNILLDVAPATSGSARGVFTLADGGQYIELQGATYRVRFDGALKSWLIIPEDNPFAFSGAVPVRLGEEGEWELLESVCLRGGGQCLGGLPLDPPEPLDYSAFEVPAQQYDVPVTARSAVRELLSSANRRLLAGDFYDPDSNLLQVLDSLNNVREHLSQDARAFFARRPPLPSRDVTVPEAGAPAQRAFIQMFDEHAGVVIGESHQAIASKRWLVENFKPLYAKGVRTLYLEHLLSDLHQADLNIFSSSGRMSNNLQRYLRALDRGHRTDPSGTYNYLELVRKARAQGIRVQALDCAASYRLDGLNEPGGTLRQQVMNYHADRVMSASQAARPNDKWIALVGDSHVNRYKGVAGLAELRDVPGLRIVDAGPGQETGITLDPGEYYRPSMGRPDGIVQADLRLAVRTRAEPVEHLDPATAPPGVIRPRA